MGWAKGSQLAEDVWRIVRPHLNRLTMHERKTVARAIVDRFEAEDCDTMDEAAALMKDAQIELR